MKIEIVSTSALVPYARNPRINAATIDGLAASIKEFGFLQPIVIDSQNVIVAGHSRYKAAQKLELKSVPIVRASNLTDQQIKSYRIIDNKIAEKSEWDLELLKLELEEIDLDLQEFEIEFEISEEPQEITAPELNSADREPFQQMTFTLHDDQVAIIKDAISKASSKDIIVLKNENSNGNALAFICEAYLRE